MTTLPPARPEAGSDRGLYLSNLTYTALSPGFHSSFLNTNGPEPVKSEICVFGSVSATRFGIMKGTFEDGLPRPKVNSPVGSFSLTTKVFASCADIVSMKVISFCPSASRAPQRLIEAMQSSAVTGWPSCQTRPSRSVKVKVFLSALSSNFSTICGLISPFSSMAKSVS